MVASGKSDSIQWHENDGDESFTEHVITDDAASVRSVFAADVDGDADLDARSCAGAHLDARRLAVEEEMVFNVQTNPRLSKK